LTWLHSLDKKPKSPQDLPGICTQSTELIHSLSTAMKIKHEQLERLANQLMAHYRAKELIAASSADSEVKAKIIAVVAENFSQEEAIEQEARQMLASYGPAPKDMDAFKMFLLAKQKLAAKKGFIL
jgi:hypothetical protein